MKTKQIYFYVLLSTLLMLCLGIVYSYSLFRLFIESSFNINKTQSGLPFMVVLLFYAISMAISGILFEKHSPTIIVIIGIIFITIGFIGSSFSHSIYMITIFYGIFIGIGIGILYTLPLKLIAQFNHPKIGFLTGITLLGFGLSPLVFAPIIEKLLFSYGLTQTFLILGISYFILLISLSLPLLKKLEPLKEQTQSISHILKQKTFYEIYILFFLATFIGLTSIGLASSIGVELLHIKTKNIALLLGLFSIFNGLGRPIFGYINDHLNFKTSVFISFISLIIATSLLYLFYRETIIYVITFSIIFFNFGGWLSLAPSATLKAFGKQHYSKAYGLMFTAYGLGAFIGNGISSFLIDTFSFQAIYMLLCILSMIGLSIILIQKGRSQ